MKYQCTECGMSLAPLCCGKCGEKLEHQQVTSKEGAVIHASVCPKKCGQIKSPMCCGQDMKCAS